MSGLFSWLLWTALHNQIDHHIHIVTTQAEHVINNFDGQQRDLLLNNLVQMEGMSVLIVSETGELLEQKYSRDITALNKAEVTELFYQSESQGHHPLHFSIHGQRFGSASVNFQNQSALLTVGYSTKILKDTFIRMLGIALGSILTILIPVTLIGYKTLKKHLKPLELVAETASMITHPKKLSKRIPSLQATIEITTIIIAFNQMLDRLQRMFEKEHEFFSDSAHTLKTPLAVLRAKVESLSNKSSTIKNEMTTVIDSAVDTVNDLLLISRIETGNEAEIYKVNLSQVVTELVELAESLASVRQVVVRNTIHPRVFIQANQRLINKAIGNVIHNSLNYVDDKGLVEIFLTDKDDMAVLTIQNTGSGISNKDLPHVFDRFYRGKYGKKHTKGSGLGLSITKAIVEHYKGSIFLESESNGRVSVQIKFPLWKLKTVS